MANKRARRALWALAVIPAVVLIAACAGQPTGAGDARREGPADAVGTVTSVEKSASMVAVGFKADGGYEYFDGTTFHLSTSDGLQDPDGLAADPNNLAVGDHIEVWVTECAESFPVQCADPLARIAPESGIS